MTSLDIMKSLELTSSQLSYSQASSVALSSMTFICCTFFGLTFMSFAMSSVVVLSKFKSAVSAGLFFAAFLLPFGAPFFGLPFTAEKILELDQTYLRQQKWLSELFELYNQLYKLNY